MALEALTVLRHRHPEALTSAAYGVLINSCARYGRHLDGLDVFGLFRLDWHTNGYTTLQPTPFVYWCEMLDQQQYPGAVLPWLPVDVS